MRTGHRAALPVPAPKVPGRGAYDPADHTVAEVLAYVAEHPDQRQAVQDAETAGKARTTLLGALGELG